MYEKVKSLGDLSISTIARIICSSMVHSVLSRCGIAVILVLVVSNFPFVESQDLDNGDVSRDFARKRDLEDKSPWTSSSELENFLRALLAVCLFTGSPLLGLLIKNAYLWFAIKVGLRNWVSNTEIRRRYDRYNKVSQNSKLFVSESSLDEDMDYERGARSVHFFSDSDADLLTMERSDRKRARSDDDEENAEEEEEEKTMEGVTLCPDNVELYGTEKVLSKDDVEKRVYGEDSNAVRSRTQRRRRNNESSHVDDDNNNGDVKVKFACVKRSRPLDAIAQGKKKKAKRDTAEEKRVSKMLDKEMRSFGDYARGNLQELFAVSMCIAIVASGWICGFLLLGVDFFGMISGATFLMAVTLFRFADFLQNVIAYLSILWNDDFDRGDMVEVPVSYGFGGAGFVVGCVYEKNSKEVQLYTLKPYQPLNSTNTKLDWAINKTHVGSGSSAVASAAAKAKPPSSHSSSSSSSLSSAIVKEHRFDASFFPSSSASAFPSRKDTTPDVVYVQKNQRVIARIVKVTNSTMVNSMVSRLLYWQKTFQCKTVPRNK